MSKQHGVDRATQALYESKHVYTKKKTHPLKRFVEVFLLCVFFKDSLPNSWCYIKSSEPLGSKRLQMPSRSPLRSLRITNKLLGCQMAFLLTCCLFSSLK